MFNNDWNSNVSQTNALQFNDNNVMKANINQQTEKKQKAKPIPFDQRKLSQITIKQIKTAKPPQPKEHLKIDGIEISQVFIIAQIVSIDIQQSHTTLKVNDLSGTLDVKKWKNDEEKQVLDDDRTASDDDKPANLVEGKWVKIVGTINHYNGRCSINAFEIIPITDYNEITYHFLECIYQHLENTVGHLDPNKQVNTNTNFNMILDVDLNNQSNDNKNDHDMNTMNKKNMDISSDEDDCFSTIQKKILDIINAPSNNKNEIGCNVEMIFKKLSDQDDNTIKEAIDFLSDEGYIYSTIDDHHYKYSGDQN